MDTVYWRMPWAFFFLSFLPSAYLRGRYRAGSNFSANTRGLIFECILTATRDLGFTSALLVGLGLSGNGALESAFWLLFWTMISNGRPIMQLRWSLRNLASLVRS